MASAKRMKKKAGFNTVKRQLVLLSDTFQPYPTFTLVSIAEELNWFHCIL